MDSARLNVLLGTVERLLRRDAGRPLEKILARTHAADVAELVTRLEPIERGRVIEAVGDEARRAEVISHLDSDVASALVAAYPPERAAQLLAAMDADDRADVLGALAPEVSQKVLARMAGEEAEEVEGLLGYGESTAGGIMSPSAFALPRETLVKDAIAALQRFEHVEMAFYLYVVNEFGHLVGVISLRQLVTSRAEQRLDEIMNTDVVSVRPEVDQEEVARIASRYGFLAVPVVDDGNKLLGIVTIDDVIDVIGEEATEDMLRLQGAGQELPSTESTWRAALGRLPGLAPTALGGVLAAVVIGFFHDVVGRSLAVAAFVPVVMAMAGAVGTQASTIVLRGLQTGRLGRGALLGPVLRQVAVGAMLGVVYGLVVAGLGVARFHGPSEPPLRLAGLVGTAITAATTLAALLGSAFPVACARLGVDPAVATAPLVTMTVDLVAILVYLAMAGRLL